MSWGKIYETTHFGEINNSIGWGDIYETIVSTFVRTLASTSNIFADAINYLASNFYSE
jgi:hypothetical protein